MKRIRLEEKFHVNKEQISIDYQQNYINIAVEGEEEINEEKENYIRQERRFEN